MNSRDRQFSRLVAVELVAEGKRQGISQKEIAEAAEIGSPQLSYYVAGTRGLMNVGTLMLAAEHLQTRPETIVGRAYSHMSDPGYMLAARSEDDDDEAAAQAAEGH